MKILSIIGARPQFVKEAVIQSEILKALSLTEVTVHTGQHYDRNMSDVFFETLGMRPVDYHLGIKANSHAEMTGKMLIELEKVMLIEKPDLVIVYGDTNSTLAGAIAASKLKIKIAHIEAGIRQAPKDMPEEINRVMTDHISNYLFSASQQGIDNLRQENIVKNVYFVGDVMYDVFLKMKNAFNYDWMDKLNLIKDDYILATVHRDFNVDLPYRLHDIFSQIQKVSKEMRVVLPLHPRTKNKLIENGYNHLLSGIDVIEPLDYLSLMGLTQNCFKILTDSGGLQKESYFSGKEATVIMPDTGWRELVDIGVNSLVEPGEIYTSILKRSGKSMDTNIYGNGDAAKKIIKILSSL